MLRVYNRRRKKNTVMKNAEPITKVNNDNYIA